MVSMAIVMELPILAATSEWASEGQVLAVTLALETATAPLRNTETGPSSLTTTIVAVG